VNSFSLTIPRNVQQRLGKRWSRRPATTPFPNVVRPNFQGAAPARNQMRSSPARSASSGVASRWRPRLSTRRTRSADRSQARSGDRRATFPGRRASGGLTVIVAVVERRRQQPMSIVARVVFATATNCPPGEGSSGWSSTATSRGPAGARAPTAPVARTAAHTTPQPTTHAGALIFSPAN